MPEEIALTPEEIAAIEAEEDSALAEFVESNGKGYLIQTIQECDQQIADCQNNIQKLGSVMDALTTKREKAQKALNALNRIAPTVLPMGISTGDSDVT